jgi:HKD family nuclease
MGFALRVKFLGQPFSVREQMGSLLSEWLAGADAFTACVAWSQPSGIQHLRRRVQEIERRGGTTEAVVGIDGGIATPEGLEDALEAFGSVHIFHDVGLRTFHPKIYVVVKSSSRLIAVGSSNLTQGGLFTNYEASLAVEFERGDREGERLFEAVTGYVEELKGPGRPVRNLDQDVIKQLRGARGLLVDEVARRQRLRVHIARTEKVVRRLFGAPPSGLARAPRIRRPRAAPARIRPPRPSPRTVVASWSKKLTESDAMRKTVGNQRAYVILGQAHHAIDQKTYFREEFFKGVGWTEETMRTGTVMEVAEIAFEVVMEDQLLGEYTIRVDHAATRIANQNNSPTWMHWSSLIDVVRQTDLAGYALTLERLSDGEFRLRLGS